MINTILQWDKDIFFFINRSMTNPFMDWLMPIIREKYTWFPLYILLLIYLPVKFKIKGFYTIVVLLACVACSDLLSAHVIKPLFHRLRPCQNPLLNSLIERRMNCGSGYSFVSSHASNHFAIAIFLILLLKPVHKWIIYPALLWASAIAFAQVYMGLHYPFDVLSGALIGTLTACLFYIGARKFEILPSFEPLRNEIRPISENKESMT